MMDIYFYRGFEIADTRAIELETKLSQTTGGVFISVRPKDVTGCTTTTLYDPWAGARRGAIIDNWYDDFYRAYLTPPKNWRWYNTFNVKPEPMVPRMKPCAVKVMKVNKCASTVQRRAQKRKQYMKGLK